MDNRAIITSATFQSPILVLTNILGDARVGEGLISVPPVVINTIKTRLRSTAQLPALEVQFMVSTLDASSPSLCSRLSVDTFVVIAAVLRSSEPCLAQERGLYLLTRSLEEERYSSDKEAAAARKAAIGENVLSNLLRYFGHSYNPVSARRWIGLLAGELLQDSEENGVLVAVGPEDTRRALGQIVTGDKSQILRLVAGTMIRGLITSGIPEGNFWPIGADEKIFAGFPKSQHHTSQWVLDFEEYLDDMFSQGISDETTMSLFAHGMNIGNLRFSVQDQPTILVTVTEDMSIMVPASDTRPAVYVDIPLPNITDMDIENPADVFRRTTSQKPQAAVLRLRLSAESAHTFYVNASQQSGLEIVLFLNDAEDAIVVRDWILEARAIPRVSRSQALDVSKGLSVNLEAIASAAELHSTSAKGDIGALDGKYISPPSPDILVAVEEQTSPGHDSSRNSTPQPSGDTTRGTRASMTSVAIPLNFLAQQAGDQRRGSLPPINRSVQPGSAPAAFARQFDEFSEHGLTSSAQWTKGMKVIDNAPELQVDISESVEIVTQRKVNGVTSMVDIASSEKEIRPAVAAERITPYGGRPNHDRAGDLNSGRSGEAAEARANADDDNVDHDSLYDASPRGSANKSHTNPEQLMLDGSTDEVRERRDYHQASTTLGRTSKQLNDSTDTGANINTTTRRGRNFVQHMQNGNGTKVARAENVPGATKSSSTASKKQGSQPKMSTARAAARPAPDVNHEDGALFDVPFDVTESPNRLRKTRSVNEKTFKGRKPAKARAKPAVYSTKVAARTLVTSIAKPQGKKVRGLPEPEKPQEPGDIDWDEGLDVEEVEDEPATVRKKAKSAPSKPALSAKSRKKKDIRNGRSPIIKAGSSKKKNTPEPKTVAAKRHSSPLALSHPRSRRAAAVKANNRIQGLRDEDVDSSAEPLQPLPATAEHPSELYADREAESDQAKSQAHEGSDVTKASPLKEGPLRQQVPSEIPIHNWAISEINIEALTVGATAPPKVHPSEATSSPEDVALLELYNEEPPVQLNKHTAPTNLEGFKKESRKETMRGEDFEQPLHHYFDDALAYSDEEVNHKPGAFGKTVPVLEADLSNKAHNEEPPTGQKRRTRDDESQRGPEAVPVRIIDSVASKLREALSGVIDTSVAIGLPETKHGLPRASAKFQPRMTEATPNETLKMTTASRRTKLDKPLHAGDDDEKELIRGRVNKPNENPPSYESLNSFSQIETPAPALTARKSVVPEAELGVVENNVDHIKSEDSEIINISSEDGEMSEYISDESAEDEVRLTAKDMSELFPPIPMVPVVVTAKPEHITAEKKTAVLEATAVSKAAEAQVAYRARKRKSRHQDDEARIHKKLRVPLPTRLPRTLTTPPKKAGTEVERECTPTPLFDDHLHRKSTLIGFSASGPRNQGILSARRPRVSLMASNDPKRHNDHQKEAIMKRKRDEDTIAAAHLVETPKRLRRSMARDSTGTSGPSMLKVSQRLSSQGARVDENGSPRPLARNPRRSDEWADGLLERLQAVDESALAPQQQIDNAVDYIGDSRFTFEGNDLPTLSTGSLPDQDEEKIFPSIRKHLPSSPNAPSQMVADLTAHRAQPGGKFINVETESIVKPSIPQDPFTGNVRRNSGSFMERLRAQGKLVEKSWSNDTSGRDPIQGLEMAPTLAADPDKTLVVVESVYSSSPSLRPDTSSESSDGPNPSSHRRSTSRGIERDAETQWRRALQPHQNSQLDILYDISNHLVRHLIDQETAVEDIIEDYRRGGTRLIEDMETTHQKEYQQFQAEVKNVGSDLVKLYEETEKRLVKNLAVVNKSPVAKLEKQWRAEQEEIKSKLDAALLACREE